MANKRSLPRRSVLALGSTIGAGLALPNSAAEPAEQLYGDAVRLSDLGANRRTFADETRIVQQAIDLAVRTRRPLFLDRAVRVSSLRIKDANGLFIFQSAPIIGLTDGTFDALITIVNSSDISWTGRLWVSCQWNPGYGCAVAFVAGHGQIASNIAVHDWSVTGARTAFRLGEKDQANGLISEITIQNGTSYGCPNVVEAHGHNTLASFVGGNLIANHLGGEAGWTAVPSDTVRVSGAHLTFVGSEIQHNADPNGAAFRLDRQSLAEEDQARFGSIAAIGCGIEAAGPLIVATDTSTHAPSPDGQVFLEGCKGYHSQRAFPFIQLAEGYAGQVKIGDGCRFRAGAPRTAPIAKADGDALLDLGEQAFDANFKAEPIRIQGGIELFRHRTVARLALKQNGELALPAPLNALGRLYPLRATFECPRGGLKEVELNFNIVCLAKSPCRLWVIRDDAVVARLPFVADAETVCLNGTLMLTDMEAGSTLQLAIESDDAGLAPVAGMTSGCTIRGGR